MKPLTNVLKFAVAVSISALACVPPFSNAVAGDLIFGFTNPTFGGNPANGVNLLNNANAQNPYGPPPNPQLSALEKLTTSLQASMISKLQTSVSGYVFDSKGKLTDGTQYTAGDYQVTINVDKNTNAVTLTTLEISTGNSTVINLGVVQTPTP